MTSPAPTTGGHLTEDKGELKIRIDGKPAFSLKVERIRIDEFTPAAYWSAVTVAWRNPPDPLYLDLWLDACLPEHGARAPYTARARAALLEHGLAGTPREPVVTIWANPHAEYPGAVGFESPPRPRAPPHYCALTDAEIGERLHEAEAIARHAHKGRPAERAWRPTSLSGMRGKSDSFGQQTGDGALPKAPRCRIGSPNARTTRSFPAKLASRASARRRWRYSASQPHAPARACSATSKAC